MTETAVRPLPSPLPPPLTGIRVIEFGGLLAGPYASSVLAQFGAEVIKVESPGEGDPLRKWRKLHDGTSVWWYSLSRNKKSITLNLKDHRGQAIARDLARGADVVIENFRPGVLEQWGLGWDDLSRVNPRLVMVRISGYGQTGPYRDRPGFAAIAEAMGGLRHVTGYPDRPPVRAGVSLGDSLAGLYGVVGALMAMHHVRANGGQGQFVDVALYESVFGVMESLLPDFSRFAYVRERSGGSLPGIAPSNTYRCRDGAYVVIAGNSDGIFKRLMHAIGRADLAADPALARNDGRAKQEQMLDAAIEAWTSQHGIDEVLDALAAADIAADPHYRERGMIEQTALPDGAPLEMPGVVPRLSKTPGGTRWIGPPLGAHTDEVLASIGLSADEIAQLRANGIL